MKICEIKDTGSKREHGDIEGLKQSIRDIGLINPITVNSEGVLLAGRRRFQAVSELGWQEVDVRILPANEPLKAFRVALDENLKRKQLTDPEVSIAIKEYDDLKRVLETAKVDLLPQCGNNPEVELTPQCSNKPAHRPVEPWSQTKTANDLGISQQAVAKSIQIATAIEEHPELASMKSGQAILSALNRIEFKPITPPMGQYRTIVIDPPWPMEKIIREERPNQIDMDYPTMSIDEIKAIKLPAYPDGCHVYLWTTQKYLPASFQILEAWGVKYQCLLTWVKNVGFTPFSWMYSTEFCLFGRIGSLQLLKLGIRTDFEAKVREHSRKPDEFYDIVRQVSPEPRIDYFSREKRGGFDSFGNEVGKFS